MEPRTLEGVKTVSLGKPTPESKTEEFRKYLEGTGLLQVFERAMKEVEKGLKGEELMKTFKENIREHSLTHRKLEVLQNELNFVIKELECERAAQNDQGNGEDLHIEM